MLGCVGCVWLHVVVLDVRQCEANWPMSANRLIKRPWQIEISLEHNIDLNLIIRIDFFNTITIVVWH